ncbi:MAG TPA: peptidase S16, partial [Psychrobacter sp.]|nr:peptidase S16 [Psychrobacter sp.]
RDDIIAAVKAGSFHIYGVHTLSEALTLMTGLPIDTMNKKGRYHKETLFGKVLSRLMLWDENQNTDDDIDDKKSKKKAKKKRQAKRQKEEDKKKAVNKDKTLDEDNGIATDEAP